MILNNFIYVLKRFKTSSILNILGLSAAFAVFIVLTIQVYYDFSYDRNFKDVDQIYMQSRYSPFEDTHYWWINTQMGDQIAEKTPLIDAYTTISEGSFKFYVKGLSPETSIEENLYRARGDFISVFTPKVLEGDLAKGISQGNNIAVSQKIAKKLFGEESALGKTIIDFYSQQPYTIHAVLEDFPENCSLRNGFYRYLSENAQSEWSYILYLKVKKENRKQLEEYLNSDVFLGKGAIQSMEDHPERKVITSLIPMTDIHLQHPSKGNGDLNTTLALLVIGIITLIIAYINFINFSVAMAPARIKALNIQRVLGMGKKAQYMIIASESAAFSFIAFIIALLLTSFIKSSPISELFSADLTLSNNINLFIILGISILFIGFLFGLYPAKQITNFDVTEALKGKSSGGRKGSKLRSALITFQFTASIALIIITAFIKIQHDYMVNYSWGIQKENIVFINLENKGLKDKTLIDDLLKDPRITDYTMSRNAPGNVQMGWTRELNGKKISLKSWPVADNYLDFFGVKVIYGNDFPVLNNEDKLKAIFNEELLKKYEFTPDDVLGKDLYTFGFLGFENPNAEIIGVAKNFNFESLKMPIQPMVFVTLAGKQNGTLFLKLSGTDVRGAVKLIENTWVKHSKESLDMQFLDENLEKLYRNENNLGKLVGIFSLITILIAIMGVYGLITFNTKYKMKEIAVRKVNGANEKSILLLINKNMLLLFSIAFVIASPIAYYFVDRWLDSFAYRTPMHWWIFPLAAIIVLIITLASASWQSYQAAIKNPIESLKSE